MSMFFGGGGKETHIKVCRINKNLLQTQTGSPLPQFDRKLQDCLLHLINNVRLLSTTAESNSQVLLHGCPGG